MILNAITYPGDFPNEVQCMERLISLGVRSIHFRKPEWSTERYRQEIERIPALLRPFVVLHDCREKAAELGFKGIHFKSHEVPFRVEKLLVSTSARTVKQVLDKAPLVDQCWVSPIFDSLSKKDHKSSWQKRGELVRLNQQFSNLVAVGGVDEENVRDLNEWGFRQVAGIGSFWSDDQELLTNRINKMKEEQSIVLSIGGFDPSGGAGVLADIKTFEAHSVLGMSVCSALTYQTEDQFLGMRWVSLDEIEKQLYPLLRRYTIKAIKIGIIESLEVLEEVLQLIKVHDPRIKIVWDPVLKASSGWSFHEGFDIPQLEACLRLINIVTPNKYEYEILTDLVDIEMYTDVLLKGGHGEQAEVEDVLIMGNERVRFSSPRLAGAKHGTGCITSSAVAAGLANGKDLVESCRAAGEYVRKVIGSTDTLLGIHWN